MNLEPLTKKVSLIFQLEYDEAGREAVRKVLSDYEGTRVVLDKFNVESQGYIRGSNIYSRFALGNAYREITQENVRPINAKESEVALANGTLTNPNSIYEDLGLVVYPKSRRYVNGELWRYLREQVKSQIDLKKPFVITGLMDVVKDDNYEDGLRLDINELTEVYSVPILSKGYGDYKFDSKDKELQKTGFPCELGRGNRILYTSKKGVRRFLRDMYLNLDARYDNLTLSSDAGRVHLARSFLSNNPEKLVAKL